MGNSESREQRLVIGMGEGAFPQGAHTDVGYNERSFVRGPLVLSVPKEESTGVSAQRAIRTRLEHVSGRREPQTGDAPVYRPANPSPPPVPPVPPHLVRPPRLAHNLSTRAPLQRRERDKPDGEEDRGVEQEAAEGLERRGAHARVHEGAVVVESRSTGAAVAAVARAERLPGAVAPVAAATHGLAHFVACENLR